jgi:hypothetical protein
MLPENLSDPAIQSYEPPPLPPETRKALRVFKAHFPKLIARHPGKWAACDGESVLWVGDSQEVLYKRCLRKGLREEEFIVLCLLSDATEFID